MLVNASDRQAADRDKTGTSGCQNVATNEKTPENTGVFEGCTFATERAGFEPAVQFYPHAALAKRCFRPLSHLSNTRISSVFFKSVIHPQTELHPTTGFRSVGRL